MPKSSRDRLAASANMVVEGLENRLCLSGVSPHATPAPTAVLNTLGTLVITGTDLADNIQLSQTGSTLYVRLNGAKTVLKYLTTKVKLVQVKTAGGNDIVNGSNIQINMNVDGGAGNDALTGGLGGDTLLGGAGNDVLAGGQGSDSLDGGLGADQIGGGTGLDTVTYASRLNKVRIALDGSPGSGEAGEGDVIGADVENATGGNGNDSITGNASANILLGGGGNDTLRGFDGGDSLVGGGGNDSLDAGAGNDTIDSRDSFGGNDTVDGGAGTDGYRSDSGDILRGVERALP